MSKAEISIAPVTPRPSLDPAPSSLNPPQAHHAPAAKLARSPLARGLFMVLALASLGLAVLGVFVPGLPSTEFVLLAAWAAARSSPRLHAWLHRHRVFGPALHNWHNGRRVARPAKWWSSVSMGLCALLMLHTIPHPWLVWPAIGCMALVSLWLWRRPEP